MRILLVGGGSGGHVTPLKAVATKLHEQKPEIAIDVITDRRFYSEALSIFSDQPSSSLYKIFSGKLRRYHTKPLWWHFVHLPTLVKNICDAFLLVLGLFQAFGFLLIRRPAVVFSKGGFVSVPVACAAHMLRIPLIIHDSDTHPGLSNRIVSRWAKVIATGMPTKYYSYEHEKMRYVGIPVDEAYRPVDDTLQQTYKKERGFDSKKPLVLVTGGGLGAESLNTTLERVGESFIREGWQIAHITGKGKAESVKQAVQSMGRETAKRWQVHEFVQMAPYILAADVVISRAGATALQELANARKKVILLPSPHLSGGHQLKNAQMVEEAGVAMVLQEDVLLNSPEALKNSVGELLSSSAENIAQHLHDAFARPRAAAELADLIIESASSERKEET